MNIEQLKHLLRASAEIVGEDQFIVIGSQSILGKYPHAPAEFLWSVEADIYAKDNTKASLEKLEAIAELSPFHETHGIYVDPVDKKTAVLAKGWMGRLVNIETHSSNGQKVTGLCLNPDDLFVSKVAAHRDKDIEFVKTMIEHDMVDYKRVIQLAATVPNPVDDLGFSKRIIQRIERLFAEVPEDQRTRINIANGTYTGYIVGLSGTVIQQLTIGDEYVLHHVSQLTPPLPTQGDLCTVHYKGGQAQVIIHSSQEQEAKSSSKPDIP